MTASVVTFPSSDTLALLGNFPIAEGTLVAMGGIRAAECVGVLAAQDPVHAFLEACRTSSLLVAHAASMMCPWIKALTKRSWASAWSRT
jgi:hypothetical protein